MFTMKNNEIHCRPYEQILPVLQNWLFACLFYVVSDIPQRPPKKLCDRFVEIASVGMNMKIYIFQVFSLFPYYFFLEKSLARLTNKMLCLVEIGQLFF